MLLVQELLDVPDVLLQSSRSDLVHELRHVAEKVAVVRHHHQAAVKALKGFFQDGLAFQVEVVGRLVKNQDVVGVQ